jgi:hypothetical protein
LRQKGVGSNETLVLGAQLASQSGINLLDSDPSRWEQKLGMMPRFRKCRPFSIVSMTQTFGNDHDWMANAVALIQEQICRDELRKIHWRSRDAD